MLSVKLKHAILVLGELSSVESGRTGLRASELKVKLGFPPGLQHLLGTMKTKGLLSQDVYRGWYYVQADLKEVTLWDLITILEPYEEYWGEWPPVSSHYPGAVGFNAALEEYVKQKAMEISIFELLSDRN